MNHSFLWIALLAFVLRLIAFFVIDGREFSADEIHWLLMGTRLWQDGFLSEEAGTLRPPLYPVFISLVFSVFGESNNILRFTQIFLSTATCWFPYAIARDIGGRQAAFVAGLFCAIYPLFVFLSGLLLAETLLLFCTGLILWSMHHFSICPNTKWSLLSGFAFALGGLCKPVLFAWLPAFFLTIWVKIRARQGWLYFFSFLSALVIGLSPWALRNMYVSGHGVLVSTNMGINLVVGHESGATGRYQDNTDYWDIFDRIAGSEEDPVLRDSRVTIAMFEQILDDFERSLYLGVKKIFLLWSPNLEEGSEFQKIAIILSYMSLLIFALLGLFHLRSHPISLSIGILVFGLTLVHAVFFAHMRFRLPIDLAFLVPASCYIVARFKKTSRHVDT